MKQKTRIASKLFAALVVLTLISCCFLGTTFARYTSTSTGEAMIHVANWSINSDLIDHDDQTNGAQFSFGDLSADDTSYEEVVDAAYDKYIIESIKSYDSYSSARKAQIESAYKTSVLDWDTYYAYARQAYIDAKYTDEVKADLRAAFDETTETEWDNYLVSIKEQYIEQYVANHPYNANAQAEAEKAAESKFTADYTAELKAAFDSTEVEFDVYLNGSDSGVNGIANDYADALFTKSFIRLLSNTHAAGLGIGNQRVHKTAKRLVATITNNSEVNATVTINVADLIADDIAYLDSVTEENLLDEVNSVLEIKLYYSTTSKDPANASAEWTEDTSVNLGVKNKKSVYIFAEVVWTTDDTNSKVDNGALADELDTIIAENVSSVSWTISYTAVQASELP